MHGAWRRGGGVLVLVLMQQLAHQPAHQARCASACRPQQEMPGSRCMRLVQPQRTAAAMQPGRRGADAGDGALIVQCTCFEAGLRLIQQSETMQGLTLRLWALRMRCASMLRLLLLAQTMANFKRRRGAILALSAGLSTPLASWSGDQDMLDVTATLITSCCCKSVVHMHKPITQNDD